MKLFYLLLLIALLSCDEEPIVEQHTGKLEAVTRRETRNADGSRHIDRTVTVDGKDYEVDKWEYTDNLNATGAEVVVQKNADGEVDLDDANPNHPAEEIPEDNSRENEPID
jgi:hypothetical protein